MEEEVGFLEQEQLKGKKEREEKECGELGGKRYMQPAVKRLPVSPPLQWFSYQ